DDESAANHGRIEFEVRHGPALLMELGLDVLIGATFPDIDLIMNQGVVHVVADGLGRAQVQGAVAVNTAIGRHRSGCGRGGGSGLAHRGGAYFKSSDFPSRKRKTSSVVSLRFRQASSRFFRNWSAVGWPPSTRSVIDLMA